MPRYSVYKAKTIFSELLKKVQNGERVIIVCWNKPIAQIVPFVEKNDRQMLIGDLKGKIKIRDDFDEIPEGFESYMP